MNLLIHFVIYCIYYKYLIYFICCRLNFDHSIEKWPTVAEAMSQSNSVVGTSSASDDFGLTNRMTKSHSFGSFPLSLGNLSFENPREAHTPRSQESITGSYSSLDTRPPLHHKYHHTHSHSHNKLSQLKETDECINFISFSIILASSPQINTQNSSHVMNNPNVEGLAKMIPICHICGQPIACKKCAEQNDLHFPCH